MNGIALSFQSKMESSNAKVLDELKLLNEIFDKLEADVAVTRNANSLLSSRLVDKERQRWPNALYSRRETLENLGYQNLLQLTKLKRRCAKFFKVWAAILIMVIWILVIGLRTWSELL